MARFDLGKFKLTPRGEYNAETAYEALDVVTYNYSSYLVLKDVTGVEPSDDGINYQLLSGGVNPDELNLKANASDVAQNYANAVKRTGTGTAMLFEDVSPISHKVKVSGTAGASVNVYGKNLFITKPKTDGKGYETIGSTIKITNPITAAFGNSATKYHDSIVLPAGTYTISVKAVGEAELASGACFQILYKLGDNSLSIGIPKLNTKYSRVYTVDSPTVFSFNQVNMGKPPTSANLSLQIQIEVGGTATDFAEAVEAQAFTLDENGKLELDSISPNMTIFAELEVSVECNLDANKIINQQQADISQKENKLVAGHAITINEVENAGSKRTVVQVNSNEVVGLEQYNQNLAEIYNNIDDNRVATETNTANIKQLESSVENIEFQSIRDKCEITDNVYWYHNGKKFSKSSHNDYFTAKIPIDNISNDCIIFGFFQNAFSYLADGDNDENAVKITSDDYIIVNSTTDNIGYLNIFTKKSKKYLYLSFLKTKSTTNNISNFNAVLGVYDSNIPNINYSYVNICDKFLNVYKKSEINKLLGDVSVVNKIYVSKTGNDDTGNGTESNPYATVFKANSTIIGANKNNRFEVIIGDGTYTDLQEQYSGNESSGYQGIMAKSYVTYKSATNNPNNCIFEWDGSTGLTEITDNNTSGKCFFHINSNTVDTAIQGIKFVGKNLRYCLHFESNCNSTPTIENCIFDWQGNDIDKYRSCIGMGGSLFSHIIFKQCRFYNSANTAAIQWHDNTYPYDYDFELGAIIECIDCWFDGLNIQVRSTESNRNMVCSLELTRCAGLNIVYSSITGSSERNYWRLTRNSCDIADDRLSNADDTTTFNTLTKIKTSTE